MAEDIADLTVDEVLELVDGGELDAAGTLEAERAGRGRSTLVAALEQRTAPPPEPDPPADDEPADDELQRAGGHILTDDGWVPEQLDQDDDED